MTIHQLCLMLNKDRIEKHSIAILGGGLSGLTVGYLLNQMGVNFELLEKEQTCGGLMRSLNVTGFTFDSFGSHIIFSKNKQAMNFLLSLLGDNLVKNRRKTEILYNDIFVKYPFENGLADLPKEENFECLRTFVETLISKAKREVKPPSNLREWFFATFGRGIAEKYLIPYNEKVWKFPVESMGLDWVQRIPDPPFQDVIKSSLGLETEGYMHQLYFYYPHLGGIESIIESLEAKISNSITMSFDVRKITKENDQWVVSDGKEAKLFDYLISSIPIHRLVKAVDSPQEVKTAAESLKYNSLISVMLGVNSSKINDLSWLYIPNKSVLTHRVSFPSNYSPGTAPPDKSSILAEITCNFGDCVWLMTDKELIDRVIADLSRLHLIKKDDVCIVMVQRTEFAYVINDLDYNNNLSIVKKYFDEIGIDLVGRFAEYKYLNMDACVQSAFDYVKKYRNSSNS